MFKLNGTWKFPKVQKDYTMRRSRTSHWFTVPISDHNTQEFVVNKAFIEQRLVYATSTLDIALAEACTSGQFGENRHFLWRAGKFHKS